MLWQPNALFFLTRFSFSPLCPSRRSSWRRRWRKPRISTTHCRTSSTGWPRLSKPSTWSPPPPSSWRPSCFRSMSTRWRRTAEKCCWQMTFCSPRVIVLQAVVVQPEHWKNVSILPQMLPSFALSRVYEGAATSRRHQLGRQHKFASMRCVIAFVNCSVIKFQSSSCYMLICTCSAALRVAVSLIVYKNHGGRIVTSLKRLENSEPKYLEYRNTS